MAQVVDKFVMQLEAQLADCKVSELGALFGAIAKKPRQSGVLSCVWVAKPAPLVDEVE